MYTIHSVEGFAATESQRSRAAAERYAILAALRENRRDRRRSRARWFTRTPAPRPYRQHARYWAPEHEA
jgi:hypothetical protein